jgi:hypothetical protein
LPFILYIDQKHNNINKKKVKSIHIAQLSKEPLATLSRPSGVAKQQTSHPRGAFFTFPFTLQGRKKEPPQTRRFFFP